MLLEFYTFKLCSDVAHNLHTMPLNLIVFLINFSCKVYLKYQVDDN